MPLQSMKGSQSSHNLATLGPGSSAGIKAQAFPWAQCSYNWLWSLKGSHSWHRSFALHAWVLLSKTALMAVCLPGPSHVQGCRTSTAVADFMWVVPLLIMAKSFSAVSRIMVGQISCEFYLLLKSAGKGLDPFKKSGFYWVLLTPLQ